MPVTDDDVAALRAYLKGNQSLRKELYGRITTPAAKTRYVALLAAAFMEAVKRRFGGRDSAAEVIEYVADVRARVPELGEKIDPSPAERLMCAILANDAHAPDIDARMRGRILIVFLTAMVSDAQYDGKYSEVP
jgi:hypothetical protein